MLQPRRHDHAQDRRGGAAKEHPPGQACLDVAEPAVPDRADGLEDRAMGDVGADRHRRAEAEQDDEDRGHQWPATHPGHADEGADEQPCEYELPAHD